jgi:hypothetical protein
VISDVPPLSAGEIVLWLVVAAIVAVIAAAESAEATSTTTSESVRVIGELRWLRWGISGCDVDTHEEPPPPSWPKRWRDDAPCRGHEERVGSFEPPPPPRVRGLFGLSSDIVDYVSYEYEEIEGSDNRKY